MQQRGAKWMSWRLLTLAVLCLLCACQSAPPRAQLNETEVAAAQRVQAYLNGIHTLQARFLEIRPDHVVTQGMVWMQRPGQLRLIDDPPSRVTLIVAQGEVVLHDAATDATTILPLSRTPLSLLLGPSVDLPGSVTVTALNEQNAQIQLTMVRTDHPDQGSLIVTLSDHPLLLKELSLVDTHGEMTTIRLFNLKTNNPVDSGLFRVRQQPQ
jgi:outer membrane lipoprotein-sorting protein